MLPKGTAALTGCTVDIGLYKMSKGLNDNAETEYTAVDEDALVDGQSFAEALGNIDIVGANISSFDATKDLATLAGAAAEIFRQRAMLSAPNWLLKARSTAILNWIS